MYYNLSVTIPLHHVVPGRLRLHIHGLKNGTLAKKNLQRTVANIPGVLSVSPSQITGNMLILFEPVLEWKELMAQIDERVQPLFSEKVFRSNAPPTDTAHPPRHKTLAHTAPNRKTANESEAWHNKSPQEIEKIFSTSLTAGLSGSSVQQRLAEYGANALPGFPPRSLPSIFMHQFASWPVALLSASAAVALLTGGILDAGIIMGVVVTNALIGTATERHAERTIEELSQITHDRVPVVREGRHMEVALEKVAVGDLLMLQPGHAIAADARVVESVNLTVDESALTGESMPVDKMSGALNKNSVPVADRINMVYRGTLVTGGSGLATVVATGPATQIGQIQALVGHTPPRPTPMQLQLDKMGTDLVILCSAVCGAVFLLGLLRGQSFLAMFQSAISLAVAAVPEGLPTVATSTLALGVQEMRKHGVLIRKLEAVESLGAVQVICLDKTGTLTQNHMQVVSARIGAARTAIEANNFHLDGKPFTPSEHSDFLKLMQLAALCNDSRIAASGADTDDTITLKNSRTHNMTFSGTPTENALLELALAAGVNIAALRSAFPRFCTRYRAENRQHMVTFHAGDSGRLAAVKGSPGDVLQYCAWKLEAGNTYPLSEADRTEILAANHDMAGEGLRVLGIAYWANPTATELEGRPLVWVGLVGMQDPIRRQVLDTIQGFHRAGIKTVMITGDQSATAHTVGKALSLNGGSQIKIFDSTELEQLDADTLEQAQIFARVSPRNKLQIVQALQRAGRVVAMTGDGINDSPALKAADVGVAMGYGGSEAACTVADVVLENDELETLLVAVSRGRTIYDNIRKSVHFLVATNISEILVMLGGLAVGQGQPLNPMQLLWINLVTDIFPGLALSMESPEPDILQRPPRDPQASILKTRDLKRATLEAAQISATALGTYGYGVWRYAPGARASTLVFNALTCAQLLHAITCRSETKGLCSSSALKPNRYLTIALTASFAAQGLVSLVPGLRRVLGTVPLRPTDIPIVGASAVLPYLLTEARKALSSPKQEVVQTDS